MQSLLVQIEVKAREYDDLKSEKVKVDVGLRTAVQSGDSHAGLLKPAADKAQKDTAACKAFGSVRGDLE